MALGYARFGSYDSVRYVLTLRIGTCSAKAYITWYGSYTGFIYVLVHKHRSGIRQLRKLAGRAVGRGLPEPVQHALPIDQLRRRKLDARPLCAAHNLPPLRAHRQPPRQPDGPRSATLRARAAVEEQPARCGFDGVGVGMRGGVVGARAVRVCPASSARPLFHCEQYCKTLATGVCRKKKQ
eukprot:COSAG05_NODE_405_length_10177_cov_2.310776_11_plen_181_part_00